MTGMEFLILKELSGLALAVGAGLGLNMHQCKYSVNALVQLFSRTQKKTRRSGLGEGTKKPARGGLGEGYQVLRHA